MILKLTAKEGSGSIYVQAGNIVAFRPCDDNSTELVTNKSNFRIIVKQTPEEIIKIWGTVVKGKTNGR